MMSVDKKFLIMSGITLIIGFMIAVQFQTMKEPADRDTRDVWELREDLLREKELELQLLSEIRSNNSKVDDYESETASSKEKVLQETLAELKEETGLTEQFGEGLELSIEPVNENILLDEQPGIVTSDLLQRLINELNMYGADEISINGNRYVNNTVIREVNNVLKINGVPINQLPLEIIVLAKDKNSAEKLYNYMKVSKSADEFFLSNLQLIVHEPKDKVRIPPYQDSIKVHYLESVKTEEGGDS